MALALKNVAKSGFADCWAVDALRRCCWGLNLIEGLPKPRCPVGLWHWSTFFDFRDELADMHIGGVCPRLVEVLRTSQSPAALGWMHTDPQAVQRMHSLANEVADLIAWANVLWKRLTPEASRRVREMYPVAEGAVQVASRLLAPDATDAVWSSSGGRWNQFRASGCLADTVDVMAWAVFGKPSVRAGAKSRGSWLHDEQVDTLYCHLESIRGRSECLCRECV